MLSFPQITERWSAEVNNRMRYRIYLTAFCRSTTREAGALPRQPLRISGSVPQTRNRGGSHDPEWVRACPDEKSQAG